MTYDVTFHPVASKDLVRFVVDVWDDPALAAPRANELCSDPEKRRFIEDAIYGRFGEWQQQAARGELAVAPTLALACAAIAGFRHGYWHAVGSSISAAAEVTSAIMPGFSSLLSPLGESIGGSLAALADQSGGRLCGHYSASGLLPPKRFTALRQALDTLAARQAKGATPALFGLFDPPARRALEQALEYAERRGLALCEAADLVEPRARRGSTDLDNLRLTHVPAELAPNPLREPAKSVFPCLRDRVGSGNVQ